VAWIVKLVSIGAAGAERSTEIMRIATLLHGYANPLKRLNTSESVNLHKCLIIQDSCRIHATRWLTVSPGKA